VSTVIDQFRPNILFHAPRAVFDRSCRICRRCQQQDWSTLQRLLPMPTMLAANHPGAVALAAGELAEHSAGPATIAPRAVV